MKINLKTPVSLKENILIYIWRGEISLPSNSIKFNLCIVVAKKKKENSKKKSTLCINTVEFHPSIIRIVSGILWSVYEKLVLCVINCTSDWDYWKKDK